MRFLLILYTGNKASLAIRQKIHRSLEMRYCGVPLYMVVLYVVFPYGAARKENINRGSSDWIAAMAIHLGGGGRSWQCRSTLVVIIPALNLCRQVMAVPLWSLSGNIQTTKKRSSQSIDVTIFSMVSTDYPKHLRLVLMSYTQITKNPTVLKLKV